jgi:hypothetical protein
MLPVNALIDRVWSMPKDRDKRMSGRQIVIGILIASLMIAIVCIFYPAGRCIYEHRGEISGGCEGEFFGAIIIRFPLFLILWGWMLIAFICIFTDQKKTPCRRNGSAFYAYAAKNMLVRLLRWLPMLSIIACIAWYFSRPVVLLHYSADAKEPVTIYYIDENSQTTRYHLAPGQVERIYAPMFSGSDFPININAPFASRDGVETERPFSRVDVYIDAETKFRMEIKYGFFDRFGFR